MATGFELRLVTPTERSAATVDARGVGGFIEASP